MSESLIEEIAIDVPPERVFAAWTEAAHLIAWWGDGTEFRTTHWESDLKVGGAWCVRFVNGTVRRQRSLNWNFDVQRPEPC